MNRLWELAPRDLPRLEHASRPTSGATPCETDHTNFAADQKTDAPPARTLVIRGVAAGMLALGFLAGSDLLAFYRASSFERAGDSSARGGSPLVGAAGGVPFAADFWPALARQARLKKATVAGQAADIRWPTVLPRSTWAQGWIN